MKMVIVNVSVRDEEKRAIKEDLKGLNINNVELGDIIYLESGKSVHLGFNLKLIYKDSHTATFWAVKY